jgi:putative membrane protein
LKAKLAKWLQGLAIYLRGIAMGSADIVPGVSGGTIAFITGIYSRLIGCLTAIDIQSIRMLLRFEIKDLWRRFDGTFLVLLFAGILSAIFSLAHLISFLLDTYPILIWSVFLGLIAASAITLLIREGVYRPSTLISFFLGMGVVLVISVQSAHQLNPSLPMVYIVGVIAISAMLLPGLSGSFLLLLFGMYEPTLEAVKTLNGPYLLVFALGAVTGLVSFSHLISWLLKHFYATTLMFLIGLLFGSLYAVWPWQSPIGANRPVLPSEYAQVADPMIIPALVCMILAVVAVLVIEYLASKFSVEQENTE